MALVLFSFSKRKPTFEVKAETQGSVNMPVEYVNYTITRVNGSLYAKIDGFYPIYNSGYDVLPMVYPTPPGTTNISLKLDGALVSWSNYTEGLHHTGIGDWSMIYAVLNDVSDFFVLEIHYEHPVQVINGSYMFLYDLNISPYLSASANKSVIHYVINMETAYENLEVNTVFGAEESLKPIEYTVSGTNPAEIRIDEISEFGKPLPGDLLISFSEPKTQEPVSALWVAVAVFAVGFVITVLVAYGLLRRRRNREAVDAGY